MAQPSVTLSTGGVLEGESVALTCFEKSSPEGGRSSRRLETAVRHAQESPGWQARAQQIARSTTGGIRSVQVEIHGLGKRGDFDERAVTSR